MARDKRLEFETYARYSAIVGGIFGALLTILSLLLLNPEVSGLVPLPTAFLYLFIAVAFFCAAYAAYQKQPFGPVLLFVCLVVFYLMWGGSPTGFYRPLFYLAIFVFVAAALSAIDRLRLAPSAERLIYLRAKSSVVALTVNLLLLIAFAANYAYQKSGSAAPGLLLVGEEVPAAVRQFLVEQKIVDQANDVKCFFGARPKEEGTVFARAKITAYKRFGNAIEKQEINWADVKEAKIIPLKENFKFDVTITDKAARQIDLSLPSPNPEILSGEYHNLTQVCLGAEVHVLR